VHRKYGGHKKACPAYYVAAAAAQAQQDRLWKKAFEADKFLVCLEPPCEPTTLPGSGGGGGGGGASDEACMICQGRVVAPVELQDRLCTEALEAKQCRASASSRRSTPPPSLVRESPSQLAAR